MTDEAESLKEINPNEPTEEQLKLIAEVDPGSVARAASLSARGVDDSSIGDILILSVEHIVAIKFTDEYKKAYAEHANRIIEDQFDRNEGWDTLETKALEGIIETIKYQKDPRFLLMAAQIANRAERRAKSKNVNPPKVIEAPKVEGPVEEGAPTVQNNIIILNMNRGYVKKQQNNVLEQVERPDVKQIPLKQSDIPPPKIVDELLSPKEKIDIAVERKRELKEDLLALFEETGVVFDKE